MSGMSLPKHVALPGPEVTGTEAYPRLCWEYLRATLTTLPIHLEIDDSLPAVCRGAFTIRVDGQVAVYDYSDYLLVDGAQAAHRHWFRFHYTAGYVPHTNLASFPPISFIDWNEFRELSARRSGHFLGHAILHSQSYEFLAESTTMRDRDLYQRRKLARESLISAFGSRVVTERLAQRDFWETAIRALVSVHIPGSWRHSLDRGQHQLLGLGVCTVSPAIWTALLDRRIEPYRHYVPVRDDLSDLVAQVEWCCRHPDDCAEIGRRAQQFFLEHSSPEAIWSFIGRRMSTSSLCA